jgi:putative phosphoesterase
MKIGLISDTHGYLDEKVHHHFKDCDEIWHGGDIGEGPIIEQLEKIAPVQVVFGNIDSPDQQKMYPEDLFIEREGLLIYMSHIGGKPPTYNPRVRKIIKEKQPHIFVCGHSHILRVMTDPKQGNLLYLNPGAAGRQGFHKMRTLLRFDIENTKVSNMQVIELGQRGK